MGGGKKGGGVPWSNSVKRSKKSAQPPQVREGGKKSHETPYWLFMEGKPAYLSQKTKKRERRPGWFEEVSQ